MKSVTKILGRVFPMDSNIPKQVLENAKNRGTIVHEWIEAYNKYLVNGGEEPTINFEYLIYADSYKKWIKEYKVIPKHTELKLSSNDVVGVIDMICKTKEDDIIVVDFKITYDYNLPYEHQFNVVLGNDKYYLIDLTYEVLTPIGHNLMVTPKEIDFVMENLSEVISYAINNSLHKL